MNSVLEFSDWDPPANCEVIRIDPKLRRATSGQRFALVECHIEEGFSREDLTTLNPINGKLMLLLAKYMDPMSVVEGQGLVWILPVYIVRLLNNDALTREALHIDSYRVFSRGAIKHTGQPEPVLVALGGQ